MKFKSFADVIRSNAQALPNEIAYRFVTLDGAESSVTHKQVFDRVALIASELRTRLEQGDRVLIVIPSGFDFIQGFYACLFSGLVAVPTYVPRFGARWDTFKGILKDSGAKAVLSVGQVSDKLVGLIEQDDSPEFFPPVIDVERFIGEANTQSHEADWCVEGEDLAFLQYTSGTTGQPKGVKINHRNILENEESIRSLTQVDESTIFSSWLPVFHDMGLVYGVMLPTYCARPSVIISPMTFLTKPGVWLKLISDYRVTFTGAPNFGYDHCISKVSDLSLTGLDLSCWKVAFSGSEMVRASTMRDFAKKLSGVNFDVHAFLPSYGMAETTLLATLGIISEEPVVERINCEGKKNGKAIISENPIEGIEIVGVGRQSGCEIIIVDPNTLMENQNGSIGEIWIRGGSISSGYWNRSNESAERFDFSPLSSEGKKLEGGYFRTGDLGYKRGYEIFVTGRMKEMLIIRGKNYFPTDIERIVQASHPAFRLNCGAAFACDDGHSEKLVMVQEVSKSDVKKTSFDELIGEAKFALQRDLGVELNAIAIIRSGTLPTTTSGKIKRCEAKDRYLNDRLKLISDMQFLKNESLGNRSKPCEVI